MVDDVAERIATLGGSPVGTPDALVDQSKRFQAERGGFLYWFPSSECGFAPPGGRSDGYAEQGWDMVLEAVTVT